MDKLSDKQDISEILAIVKMKNYQNAKYSKNPIFVLIDRPSKKGQSWNNNQKFGCAEC